MDYGQLILFRRLYFIVNRTIHIHISLPPTPVSIGVKNGHALIDNGNPLEEFEIRVENPIGSTVDTDLVSDLFRYLGS